MRKCKDRKRKYHSYIPSVEGSLGYPPDLIEEHRAAIQEKYSKERHTMSERTFKVESPHMEGNDIRHWQKHLNYQFGIWNVNYDLAVDGDYGVATRTATSDILMGLGIQHKRMKEGVTPDLRRYVRARKLTVRERALYIRRAGWRRKLKKKYNRKPVHSPLVKINSSSWGWHGRGVHDGVDLMCDANMPLLAICDARVIDVRSGGWWGKNPSGDTAKGDGIIQIECLTNKGPFRRGLHFGYGHAEGAKVKVGDIVKAGDVIGRAGFARAWHTHFMCNGGNTMKGIGDRDPMIFVNYALKNQ